MPSVILDHVRGKDIPPAWRQQQGLNPEDTFKVTIESEHHASASDRAGLLKALQSFSGNEDSAEWIENIKSARTRSELTTPLR